MKRTAAIFGFLGVALGAFGAHGLNATLKANGTLDHWEKATLYHLVHAAILLLIAWAAPTVTVAFRLFAAGIVIFSGSLYILAVTDMRWLGAITPVGGLCLLGGWLWLAILSR